MANAQPIPEPYNSVSPHLTVKNAAEMIEFYKKAFDAVELHRMPGPGGSVMHAAVQIGNSVVMLNDPSPMNPKLTPPVDMDGRMSSVVHLYVKDADAVAKQASPLAASKSCPCRTLSGATATASSRTPAASAGPSPPMCAI